MLQLKKGFSNSVVYEKAAMFVANGNFRHKRRKIENYEIIYVTGGALYIQEETEQYGISEGQALILSPGREHFGYEASPEGTSFFWAHYFLNERGRNSRLSEHFRMLIHMSGSVSYNRVALNQTIALILSETAMSDEEHARSAEMTPVLSWIEENGAGRLLTAADVANGTHMSRSSLDRLLAANAHSSLSGYLTEKRLSDARHYIFGTNFNINEIAARLGYGSADRFIKFFRYHEGISPKKLRDAYYVVLVHNK